jgi:hypothetical protein
MLESHLVPQEKLNIYHEVHDLILSAWLPGESKSVVLTGNISNYLNLFYYLEVL